MSVKVKFCTLLSVLSVVGLLLLSACGEKEPTGDDRETFPQESYAVAGDATVLFHDGLDSPAFSADSHVGEWISKCGASDRDDQFDVYTLRHETVQGCVTTFTYLIYYPHGGASVTAAYEVLEGENGYVVNLRYTPGGSSDDYALSYLSVTLPTENPPRLRLVRDGDVLGQLASVSEGEIPIP
jgi:hypothetical protein